MKGLRTLLICAAVVFGIWYGISYLMAHEQEYTIGGTCKEKVPTNDRYGHNVYYHVLIKMDDGTCEDHEVTLQDYISYELNHHYWYTRTRYNFDSVIHKNFLIR